MPIVRTLGAPVIEPPGKAARSAAAGPTPGAAAPQTVETNWCTEAKLSTSISPGTCTDPGRQTRPRSFLSRSTIMRFSARSFSLAASAAAISRSRAGSAGSRGAVPLIGLQQGEGCASGQVALHTLRAVSAGERRTWPRANRRSSTARISRVRSSTEQGPGQARRIR